MPVPAWRALRDVAREHGLSVPELLEWCEVGEGRWWVNCYQQEREIDMACLAEALAREAPPPAPTLPLGYRWMGGPTDPRYTCSFTDEGDDPAQAA